MVWEIVALVGLAAVFVVLKVLQSEGERKRRLERAERDLRVKAASGGFAPKQWEYGRRSGNRHLCTYR